MRDDERDRTRPSHGSHDRQPDIAMAELVAQHLKQMLQIPDNEQRQRRDSIEGRDGAPTAIPQVPSTERPTNLVGDGFRYKQSESNLRPTVRFDETGTPANRDRPYDAAKSNDTWVSAPRRDDGKWYVPEVSDGALSGGAGGPNYSTATRAPYTGGQQAMPGNRPGGGRRCYGCGSFSHLRRDCPRTRGGQGFVGRVNNCAVEDTDDDRNATSYYLPTVINNHNLLGVLDSGSSTNILPARFARNIELQPSNKTLLVANGTKMDVTGECVLTVRIANRISVKIKFVVSESATDVILGSGFLYSHNVWVHYGKGILCYGRRRIKLTTKKALIGPDGYKWLSPLPYSPCPKTLYRQRFWSGILPVYGKGTGYWRIPKFNRGSTLPDPYTPAPTPTLASRS